MDISIMGAITGIFGYATEQLNAGTPMSYVALGILGLFAWLILYHLLHGLRRGIFRQIAHTAIMLLAAVVAFFATKYAATYLFDTLMETSLEELLISLGATDIDESSLGILSSLGNEPLVYLLALPVGVMVTPLVFMLLFAVLNVLFRIIYLILRAILHIGKGHGAVQRLTGMLLGACEGLIIASILILPFAAMVGSADEMMSAVANVGDVADGAGDSDDTDDADDTADDSSDMDIDAMYEEYLKPLASHPVFAITKSIGGELVLDGLATFDLGAEEPINTREEFASIMGLILVDGSKLMEADFNKLTDDNKEAMTNIIDYVGDSEYMATIMAGMLHVFGDLLEDQMADAGDEGGIDFVTPMFAIFKDISATEVGGVLTTFKDFYFLISDEGVLEAISSGDNDTLAEVFTKTDATGKSVLSKATAILNNNPRTTALVTTLTKMTFAMMSGSEEMGEMEEVYDEVKNEVNDTVDKLIAHEGTREEKVDTAKDDITAALAEHEIELEAEVIDDLADKLVTMVEDDSFDGSFDEADFNNFILEYYDSYIEYMNSQEGGSDGDGSVDAQ